METVWKCPFCSSFVSDLRNRWRLGTSLSMDVRVSELFQSVGGSKTELLPSDCVCKACFQSVEKLLKVESSSSSILDTLKDSIQALALTQTISGTQSGQRSREESEHQRTFQPTTKASSVVFQSPERLPNGYFDVAACTRHQLLTTPLNEYTLANPYFRVHTANISLRH